MLEKEGMEMKANEVIKIRRNEMGMTQKDLAERVGVTEATVSRWESGDIKSMKRSNIAALSSVLNVPPAVLMDWESYDAEVAERKRLTDDFVTLSNVAKLEHLRIALDLLRRLEGKQ
jgi:transcriptional regulator with XRE-family HTH domain